MRSILWICILAIVAGCGWFDDPRPDEALVTIQGTPGAEVRLIVSKEFIAGVGQNGVTRVEIFKSDTLIATVPFQLTTSIRDYRQFFSQVSRLESDVDSVTVQVFLDERRQFDESGPLLENAPYRFVYVFNNRLTDNLDVVF